MTCWVRIDLSSFEQFEDQDRGRDLLHLFSKVMRYQLVFDRLSRIALLLQPNYASVAKHALSSRAKCQ